MLPHLKITSKLPSRNIWLPLALMWSWRAGHAPYGQYNGIVIISLSCNRMSPWRHSRLQPTVYIQSSHWLLPSFDNVNFTNWYTLILNLILNISIKSFICKIWKFLNHKIVFFIRTITFLFLFEYLVFAGPRTASARAEFLWTV